MTDLKMEKFSPTKAELQDMVSRFKQLDVLNINDSMGYKIVKEAIKECTKLRTGIQAHGKSARREAIDFQKGVITKENELIGIFKPVETELRDKIKKIDDEKVRKLQADLLPERKKMLKGLVDVKIELSDDEILLMSPESFKLFYTEKHTEMAFNVFAKAFGYSEKKKDDFVVEKKGVNSIILYKRVATFNSKEQTPDGE